MQVKISLDLLFIHEILVGFPATLLPDASFPGLLAFYVKVRCRALVVVAWHAERNFTQSPMPTTVPP